MPDEETTPRTTNAKITTPIFRSEECATNAQTFNNYLISVRRWVKLTNIEDSKKGLLLAMNVTGDATKIVSLLNDEELEETAETDDADMKKLPKFPDKKCKLPKGVYKLLMCLVEHGYAKQDNYDLCDKVMNFFELTRKEKAAADFIANYEVA